MIALLVSLQIISRETTRAGVSVVVASEAVAVTSLAFVVFEVHKKAEGALVALQDVFIAFHALVFQAFHADSLSEAISVVAFAALGEVFYGTSLAPHLAAVSLLQTHRHGQTRIAIERTLLANPQLAVEEELFRALDLKISNLRLDEEHEFLLDAFVLVVEFIAFQTLQTEACGKSENAIAVLVINEGAAKD